MNTKELIEKFNKTLIKIPKIGRNRLCPCGSGKKFKKCHLIKFRSKNNDKS